MIVIQCGVARGFIVDTLENNQLATFKFHHNDAFNIFMDHEEMDEEKAVNLAMRILYNTNIGKALYIRILGYQQFRNDPSILKFKKSPFEVRQVK